MNIDKLKKTLEEAQKTLQKESKGALKEAFIEFFDANPNIQSIRWTQYTPYFNDGEECQFGVNDFTFATKQSLKEADAKGADEEDEDAGGYEDAYLEKSPDGKAVRAFARAIHLNEAFKAAFGDHVQVTASRKGFSIDEHEHE